MRFERQIILQEHTAIFRVYGFDYIATCLYSSGVATSYYSGGLHEGPNSYSTTGLVVVIDMLFLT